MGALLLAHTVWRRPTTYEQLKGAEEFAFVVTDIEDSTGLSQQDPAAFKQVGRGGG